MRNRPKLRWPAAGCALALAIACAGQIPSLLGSPGARVAIVVFEDLQWPDCASADPVIRQAAQAHNVPLVIHDFPLPRHNWSFQASINARYFGQQSQQLGEQYRGYILQNQLRIGDETALREWTEKFAGERQLRLPLVMDADGKLAEGVRQDFLLGQRIGVERTPTVFVIGNGAASPAMVGQVNRERLSQVIERMQRNAKPLAPLKAPLPARGNRP
jgi:protein-disulfide isomerase